MSLPIGMRIPPWMGGEGIESVAGWAKQAGLNFLDVPELTPAVRDACAAAGVGIGSVDATNAAALLSRDEGRRLQAVDATRQHIAQIAELGGTILFMCLVPEDLSLPRSEAFAIWKETFPDVVRQAEQNGVYIAIEGWPGPAPYYPTLGCTPETWRAMFEAIPSRHFGLNYDPSHLVRLGIDYLRALDEFGSRVTHCHGKDTAILAEELYESGHLPATFGAKYGFSEGSWRYTIPGHGLVDWEQVAGGLARSGYRGGISIELEDHYFWGTLEAERKGIAEAAAHLARFF
ncbi:sugar phosphate isomerase/epimerase [Cohnella sp. REN36]|uniref:sugar phosphate isomerase/epimerase family protein n=1 Tax=Cohnella sp. REN36 TaxID=2887347 RepID=UPI001D1392DB|nr:sugar phosphate isomerase/epimerase [Cohnella sp. REN36]